MFYFKRLHIDAFFFSRLRYFVSSFNVLLNTIVLATREEFTDYTAKLQADPLGDPGPAVPKSARLKLHILFFFFLRDFFFKKAFLSKLIPSYLIMFSLDCSAGSYRAFFFDFGFAQLLKFRSYFSGLFFDRFAAPDVDEPIVFYDPMQHSNLRSFYWEYLDRAPKRTVMSIGRARGFHFRTKWFPLLPAFTGEAVEAWYMDEPVIDLSNWEYALAGARLPQVRFLEDYIAEEREGVLELRLSFYFMVFGK